MLKRNLNIDFFGPGQERQNRQKWWSGNGNVPFKFEPKISFPLLLNAKILGSGFLNFSINFCSATVTISYLCYYNMYPAI